MKLKLFEQFISEGVEADIMPAAPVTPAGAASSAPGSSPSYEVITNQWNMLPNDDFKGYLVFSNLVELRSNLIPNGELLKTYFTNNKSNLIANGYVLYSNNNKNYLLAVDIDNGQVGSGDCNIEKGTSNEYDVFYGKEESYNKLPIGATEYIIIKKTNDINYSLLGALINGKPCWTLLSKSLTSKYGHLSNGWK